MKERKRTEREAPSSRPVAKGEENMRRTWIKLYCDQTLRGTCFTELAPDERFVFFGFLLLAGDSAFDGKIALTEMIGYTDAQLAELLKIELELLLRAKEKMIKFDKIKVLENNIILIVNWPKYQSEYRRQREFQREYRSRKKSFSLRPRPLICESCGEKEPNVLHHIDGDQTNNASDNLIWICFGCHTECHHPKVPDLPRNLSTQTINAKYRGDRERDREGDREEEALQEKRTLQEKSHALTHEKMIEIWNFFANEYGLALILDIKKGTKRFGHVSALLKRKEFNFDKLLDMISQSPFLLGRKGKEPFFITFDWAIAPSNYQKIIEGNYIDRKFSGIKRWLEKKENQK